MKVKPTVAWEKDGLSFSIIFNKLCGHYCGYVRFPKRVLRENGYGGIVTYIPVHGGITYGGSVPKDGSVEYGFDCAHTGDEEREYLRDLAWLKLHCEFMAKVIVIAKKYEKRYLRNISNAGKAKVIDEMQAECDALDHPGKEYDRDRNFGEILRLLSGEL